jgi:hypothetical protein
MNMSDCCDYVQPRETTIARIVRRLRPRQRRSNSGRAGSQWDAQWCYGPIGVFRCATDQKWSPALTERRREFGVIVFGWRLGASKAMNVWTDGKEPKVTAVLR